MLRVLGNALKVLEFQAVAEGSGGRSSFGRVICVAN